MARTVRYQGRISQMFNEDFHTCMFACFLSQEEPKQVHQALKDPSWIEAMQEELLQFKMQKVWILVDLPYGKRAIGGSIDYEEVFAPVARIEAIRLFLAYASFMGFLVYQIDDKGKNYGVYGFINDELPSEYYKKLFYKLHMENKELRSKLKNLSRQECGNNNFVPNKSSEEVPMEVILKDLNALKVK
nr:hypothetical protein [Tanacetum cinerariifolium]